MKNLSLLIIGLLLFQFCNSQNIKKIDWDCDIDSLAKELSEKHYNFFTEKSKDDYYKALNQVKTNKDKLDDFGIALNLQQVIASFGDSHTRVNYGEIIDKEQVLPLYLYWFKEGLFVLHTTQENSEILGHQILSVNGTSVKTIQDSLSTLITVDNQAMVKFLVPKLFPLIQVLNYFGFVEGQKVELELKDLEGNTKKYIMKPAMMNRQNRKMFLPDSLPFCFKNERAFFIDNYQASDNIYYLQYNKCWSKELELKYRNGKNANKLPSFKEFEDKVFETLESKPIQKIVFDIRFNGGGSSSQGTYFIEKLAKFLDKNPEINLYVVLGRTTFSSAILNAMDCKRLTNATFVGEETGGKPNHFGEVKSFRLPNSKLRVNYSSKYFKRSDEDVKTLAPDYYMEPSFKDYKIGLDPVMEWIKKQ